MHLCLCPARVRSDTSGRIGHCKTIIVIGAQDRADEDFGKEEEITRQLHVV